MQLTVTLTPQEVKQAIAEFIMNNVAEEMVCEVADVSLHVDRAVTGQGMSEFTTYQFTKATAKVGEAE